MIRLVLAILSLLWLASPPAIPASGSDVFCLPLLKNGVEKEQKACWWEIKILLESKGKYKYKESKTSFIGKYAYTILWTGCIERDQQDFILYHEDSELLKWEPQESIGFDGSKKSRTTRKFSEEPHLELHYVLRKGQNIHFDFLVKGFDIPQHDSAKKVYLHLPASKGNSDNPTDLEYDLYIRRGSNNVSISRDILDQESGKKEFRWAWQHEKWFGSGEGDPYLLHFHNVDVEVSVIRHPKKQL